ncbi:VHS domain family protein [Clavispora lusitaniae]|uniref:VHS domain family protein n=1 Tax=Clavispora lusitaniae TaxID=36911 RepID=UPI00202C38A2|nr:VHS domain family protein [Clavispora lusitaniae]
MTELEKKISKATDPTLTGDNWQYILDTCDCITANPETNTKEAIKLIKTRLTLKDANVILRTLTLIIAVAENCGSRMKQEIASTSFLQESLIRKLGDRRLHRSIKFRIAEVISQLNDSFDSDPSLKPIRNAYETIKVKYPQYLSTPPDKPEKKTLSREDRKNEELELERALKLSVQEYERQKTERRITEDPNSGTVTEVSKGNNDLTGHATNAPTNDQARGVNQDSPTSTISNVKKVCALYDLISYEPDELSFKKGDIITVIESVYRDWWRGMLPDGKVGIFPLNYVTPVIPKSAEEEARELALETRLVNIDSKKVEKLLALLSANPESVSEDEVTALYNEVIPLKTTLALLIDKYSSRKDELAALHDQVNAETKLYDSFVDQIVNLRAAPHAVVNSSYPAQSSGGRNNGSSFNYLEQQPTSAGFGNSDYARFQYGQPSGSSPSQAPVTTFTGESPSTENQGFSHHSHFPPVKNIR